MTKSIEKPTQRPVKVKIPHSIFLADIEDHSICLFCETNAKSKIDTYLQQNPVDGLVKVISMSQVVKLYKAYKDRKELLAEHSHFLCDEKILPQLYNALGKVFLGHNAYPVPIDISDVAKLSQVVEKAINSYTYMRLSGQNITVRMGYTSMNAELVTENIIAGLTSIAEKLPGSGWNRIQSIHVKTATSPALPVYGKIADEALQFVKEKAKMLSTKNSNSEELISTNDLKQSSKTEIAPKDTKKRARVTQHSNTQTSDIQPGKVKRVKSSKTTIKGETKK